jgi:hypothetical protein
MRLNSSRHYEVLLREGINAAQNGSKNLAWSLLTQATKMNLLDATPWLWLTETTDDHAEKKEYLENALAADPRNFAARKGLAKLTGKRVESNNFSPDSLEQFTKAEGPTIAKSKETFLCP